MQPRNATPANKLRTRLRLAKRLALLAATSAALFPAPAAAQEFTSGVGVFAGWTFGPRAGFEWGVEAFTTHVLSHSDICSERPRAGFGPAVQFAMIGLRDPRLTLLAHGGGEFERNDVSLTGELGATYRFGSQPGVGIHVGVTPGLALLNASARAQFLLNDYSLTGGVRILPTYGNFATCIVGRPLRTDEGFAPMSDRSHAGALPKCQARSSKQELAGRGWERDAQYECASVPAFLELAEALLFHDAPPALVERALDAAEDEIAHAELCGRMASHYLGAPVIPALPAFSKRAPLAGVPGLVRLGVESWQDGCLGEGAAAKQAMRAAKVARDRHAKAAQHQIANDELRHAELAWSVLQWTLERAGSAVSDAVGALRNAEPAAANAQILPDRLEIHGRLSATEANGISERHAAESRRRLDSILEQR